MTSTVSPVSTAAVVKSIAFAVASPTLAQSAPDDAKVALAKDILKVTGVRENMTEMVDSLLPSMLAFITKSKPNLSADVLDRFKALTRKNMIATIPEFLNQDARIWAQHFSKDELKQIDQFYRSKAGRDLVAKMPKVRQQTMPMADTWGRAEGAEAMKAAIKQLRKEGVKI